MSGLGNFSAQTFSHSLGGQVQRLAEERDRGKTDNASRSIDVEAETRSQSSHSASTNGRGDVSSDTCVEPLTGHRVLEVHSYVELAQHIYQFPVDVHPPNDEEETDVIPLYLGISDGKGLNGF